MKRTLLAVVLGIAGLAGGAALSPGAAQADQCPAYGCTYVPEELIYRCLDPYRPLHPCPEEGDTRYDHQILCVGGDNQRKPGYYQGICIYGP